MAGGANLTVRASVRLLALSAAVLLMHIFTLDWLTHRLDQSALLQPLVNPMFTRLLQPQSPAGPPAPASVASTGAQPGRASVRAVAQAQTALAPGSPASAPRQEVPAQKAPEPSSAEPTSTASTAGNDPTQAPKTAASQTVAPPAVANPPELAAGGAEVTAQAAAPAASSPTSRDMAGWPADTRLNYRLSGQMRGGELYGRAQVQWQREDRRYQTRVEIELYLLTRLTLISQGEVTPQGLAPRVYEEQRRSGPRGARLDADSITLANGRTVARPPGVQDTASQFVELSHRFSSGRDALEVGRSVSFWMARPGAVDLWTYDIVEREVLRTPQLGAVEAFHLKPRPIANPRGTVTAEMWFAPSLQYLPVRIRVSMSDDTFVDLMVETIQQR